ATFPPIYHGWLWFRREVVSNKCSKISRSFEIGGGTRGIEVWFPVQVRNEVRRGWGSRRRERALRLFFGSRQSAVRAAASAADRAGHARERGRAADGA